MYLKGFLYFQPFSFPFFANVHKDAAGINNSLLNGNTFIRSPHISFDKLLDRFGKPVRGSRTQVNTIAHEITHTMLVEKIGRWDFMTSGRWTIEGYCDYIGIQELLDDDINHVISKYSQGDALKIPMNLD